MPDASLVAAINNVADRLGIPAVWLDAIIRFESNHTYSPSVKNPYSGATGLIQFMPKTAADLGTSLPALAAMSGPAQTEYVYRYFRPFIGRMRTLEDAYMAVLWPAAVGQPNSYVLFAAPSLAYQQNKNLDRNNDGKVTKDEAAAQVLSFAGMPATLDPEPGEAVTQGFWDLVIPEPVDNTLTISETAIPGVDDQMLAVMVAAVALALILS